MKLRFADADVGVFRHKRTLPEKSAPWQAGTPCIAAEENSVNRFTEFQRGMHIRPAWLCLIPIPRMASLCIASPKTNMTDTDILLQAYAETLRNVYATFFDSSIVADTAKKRTQAEERFKAGVLNARAIRDRAILLAA